MWKKNLRRFIGKLLISLLTIFLVATFNFFLIRFMRAILWSIWWERKITSTSPPRTRRSWRN